MKISVGKKWMKSGKFPEIPANHRSTWSSHVNMICISWQMYSKPKLGFSMRNLSCLQSWKGKWILISPGASLLFSTKISDGLYYNTFFVYLQRAIHGIKLIINDKQSFKERFIIPKVSEIFLDFFFVIFPDFFLFPLKITSFDNDVQILFFIIWYKNSRGDTEAHIPTNFYILNLDTNFSLFRCFIRWCCKKVS